jgi:hypothetical protein
MTDDADTGSILQEDDADETGRLIRPYAMTGGRTGTDGDSIGLEAQIQASTRASTHLGAYRWEAARLIELVQTPTALVEVAARLEIPIGVTRVLVADLVRDGAVVVHIPRRTQSFTSLLEKVLDGVRSL